MNPLQMPSNPVSTHINTGSGLPPVNVGLAQDPLTPGKVFKSGIIGLLILFQGVFSFVVFVISAAFSFLMGLIFLLPILLQLSLFILFLYIIEKIWGGLRLVYNPAAKSIERMVKTIVSGWNRTANSINRLARRKLLATGNANVNIPTMPVCIEFVMLIIRPIANGIQKSFHKAIYA